MNKKELEALRQQQIVEFEKSKEHKSMKKLLAQLFAEE